MYNSTHSQRRQCMTVGGRRLRLRTSGSLQCLLNALAGFQIPFVWFRVGNISFCRLSQTPGPLAVKPQSVPLSCETLFVIFRSQFELLLLLLGPTYRQVLFLLSVLSFLLHADLLVLISCRCTKRNVRTLYPILLIPRQEFQGSSLVLPSLQTSHFFLPAPV